MAEDFWALDGDLTHRREGAEAQRKKSNYVEQVEFRAFLQNLPANRRNTPESDAISGEAADRRLCFDAGT